MFTAALFKIAKIQKQLKYPKTNEWIKKMWINKDTHTMEYYSAIKKKKLLQIAATWVKLEGILQSKVNRKTYGLMPLRSRV